MERKKFFQHKIEEPNIARRLFIPSWEETKGMLELRTHNNERLHGLFLNNQDVLREYYDNIYSQVLERRKLKKIVNNDIKNKIFSSHFRIIRETVTQTIEKPSKGWAKHIRREKALSGK